MTIDRSHKGLTRGAVVLAAIEIVEADGLDALTVRAVAKRLGSSPMSVYNHAEDRDDLLVGMLEAGLADLPIAARGGLPADRLTQRYTGLHDYLAARTWIPRVLISGTLVATASFAFADACIGDFLEAGLAPADAIYAHGVIWHLLLGEILDRHPDAPPATPTQRERALRAMDVTAYPNYAHVLSVLDPTDAPPPCQFPRSLALTLDGVLRGLTSR